MKLDEVEYLQWVLGQPATNSTNSLKLKLRNGNEFKALPAGPRLAAAHPLLCAANPGDLECMPAAAVCAAAAAECFPGTTIRALSLPRGGAAGSAGAGVGAGEGGNIGKMV